jgi:hypothetical protein
MKLQQMFILLFLLAYKIVLAQYSENIFKTDTSEIKIIKNSVYHIYEETYKNKDSVWYSVHYIKDTARINTEGWKRRNGKLLGVWNEFNYDQQLLYTWDHDKGNCEVNKDLFPYHDILEKMKLKADSLIITNYSKEFYDKHIRFEYNCVAYNHYKAKFDCCEDSIWTDDFLGSWIEPIKTKPNSFKFRYEIRLNESDQNGIELGICLDSAGNYFPSDDDKWNNYGFEKVTSENKTFEIDIKKSTIIAKQHGLIVTDSSDIKEFLIWENFKKQTLYNGQFRYYITDLTSKTEYKKGKDRQGIVYRYNVYSFNPWTGDFI